MGGNQQSEFVKHLTGSFLAAFTGPFTDNNDSLGCKFTAVAFQGALLDFFFLITILLGSVLRADATQNLKEIGWKIRRHFFFFHNEK